MRVIAKSSLVKFWELPGHEDAKAALESWHDMALKAIWRTPQDLKDQIGNASICGKNRVVSTSGGTSIGLWSRCSIEPVLPG